MSANGLGKCMDCGIPIKLGPKRCKPCSHDATQKRVFADYQKKAQAKREAKASTMGTGE